MKRTARDRAATKAEQPGQDLSLLSEYDLHLFNEGSHFSLHEHLGAHPRTVAGVRGTAFAVWAPNAREVSVIGDFNGWRPALHALAPRGSSGIWEGFVPGLEQGAIYKYSIVSQGHDYRVEKADPFAFFSEVPPRTGSIVRDLDYPWGDQEWMASRAQKHLLTAPMSIYEVHLGSWRRVPEEDNRSLGYRELAPLLVDYVLDMGFTHVEFMPVMEHPFYGSWGYQVTGYFAPSARYGTPQDFMYLIDSLHQAGIGVILDWVPSHFPSDEHGLAFFDGTHLFEHADPRMGLHPDWNSAIFNYGRHEVRSILISSALFWLSAYHADGLRVDAVASMLYLDYSREEGEWIPNEFGGRENLEAIAFLRRMNEEVYKAHPDVQTIAEESTAWPMVSRPTYVGGLGFGLKWDMGWMHDTLAFLALDPIYRKYHHDRLTFRMLYAFNENFALPLSHDEVVHGKGSLLRRMAGDDWQKFANLRLLFAYMYATPGKKLLFMGAEFASWDEWYHDGSLDWHLIHYDRHNGVRALVRDLNALYRSEAALHHADTEPSGFEWVDPHDSSQNCLTFLRRSGSGELILAALNFTPIPRENYRVGVPRAGFWREILNSDAIDYDGSGHGNRGGTETDPAPSHGHRQSLNLTLPPLGAVFFKAPADSKRE
jgi:1,4-alpha-glucan branching enzyme